MSWDEFFYALIFTSSYKTGLLAVICLSLLLVLKHFPVF